MKRYFPVFRTVLECEGGMWTGCLKGILIPNSPFIWILIPIVQWFAGRREQLRPRTLHHREGADRCGDRSDQEWVTFISHSCHKYCCNTMAWMWRVWGIIWGLTERCESMQGFLIFHSFGGGTGRRVDFIFERKLLEIIFMIHSTFILQWLPLPDDGKTLCGLRQEVEARVLRLPGATGKHNFFSHHNFLTTSRERIQKCNHETVIASGKYNALMTLRWTSLQRKKILCKQFCLRIKNEEDNGHQNK